MGTESNSRIKGTRWTSFFSGFVLASAASLFMFGSATSNTWYASYESILFQTLGSNARTMISAQADLKEDESQPPAKPELPTWVTGGPMDFAKEMDIGSEKLTDKSKSLYHFAYQPYLSNLVRQKFRTATEDNPPRIKFLEIGLGCHKVGGMINNTPGGSARGWRHLFNLVPGLQFDLHLMEYDEACARKWEREYSQVHGIATMVHTGDQSSPDDLNKMIADSGSDPFDVIVDDASHINWHMIASMHYLMPHVAEGGLYIVEDILSSCRNWRANIGVGLGAGTGGSRNCIKTKDGKNTFLGELVEMQILKAANPGKYHLPGNMTGVNHIDFFGMIAVLEKSLDYPK